MKSRIISLPDLSKMEINPEYLLNSVEEETVNEIVENLLKTLGEVVTVDKMEENACLYCENENKNLVLIYPSMNLPGVEIKTSVNDVIVGSTIEATVNSKPMILSVQKILVTRPCNEDQIAEKCGIEGVSNIYELKNYLKEREEGKLRETHKRELVMEMISYLSNNSEKEIDEEEISAWTKEQARISYDENMSMGIDLRITDEGMISEEEVLNQLAEDMRSQFVSSLASKKFAEENNFSPDENALREVIRVQMAEMGDVDDAAVESQVSMAVENEYFRFIYEALTEKAEEVLK